MSSYWAGYAGIGMMISEDEMKGFVSRYKKLLGDTQPDLDLSNPNDFWYYLSNNEGVIILSNDVAEGFLFYPYMLKGKPNTEYEDTAPCLGREKVYIFPADFDNNSVGALFIPGRRYNSFEDMVSEFKRKYQMFFPEDFDWKSHIGQYQYACYIG